MDQTDHHNPISEKEIQHDVTPIIIKTILLTSAVIFVLIGFGFYAYQKLQFRKTLKTNTQTLLGVASNTSLPNQIPSGGDENLDTDLAYQKAMTNAQYIPPSEWKKYMTKDNKYSFYYPPDWKLLDESKNVDLYNDGTMKYQQNITISNGDYLFKSYNPLAWGPNACLYPDSPTFGGPADTIENFAEIKGIDGVFRRPDPSTYDVPGSKLRWFICKKGTDEFFTSVSGFGSTYFDTPSSYDSNMLIIMDQILESFSSANTQ